MVWAKRVSCLFFVPLPKLHIDCTVMNFSIKTKIFLGNLAQAIFLVANSIFIYYSAARVQQLLQESLRIVSRTIYVEKEIQTAILSSSIAITRWVNMPNDGENKAALIALHADGKKTIDLEVSEINKLLKDSLKRAEVKYFHGQLDSLLGLQKQVMTMLNAEESYQNESTMAAAQAMVNDKITPFAFWLVRKEFGEVLLVNEEQRRDILEETLKASITVQDTILLLMTIFITLGFGIFYFSSRNITLPILAVKDTISQLAQGILPPPVAQTTNDEIGDMGRSVNQLRAGLERTTNFASSIGNGEYQSSFTPLSEQDALGKALMDMRDKLQKSTEESQQRNWANEGVAKFGEMLRTNTLSLEKLSAQLLTELIKYVGANQGTLFILNDDVPDDIHMHLTAAYAWNRQRFVQKKLYLGEGSVGQAWQEKDTLFITDVPNEYIQIGSGMGDANPRCIVILPLIYNEKVFGVMELASFNVFSEYKVDFLKRIGEAFASSVSSVKVTDRTQRLLQESQQMSEQLKMQEEEMRQNLEELMATQDELQRKVYMYEKELKTSRTAY